MNKEQFVKEVQAITGLEQDQAEQGASIVLSLLSHRLIPEEKSDLEAQLTSDLKKLWNSDTWIVNFLSLSRQYQLKYRKKEELYSLIKNELEKHQLPIGAEPLAMAVFHVLKTQISEGEAQDVSAQLPQDIKTVWLAA